MTRQEPPDEDGNRTIENAVLLGFFVVVAAAGAWLLMTMADVRNYALAMIMRSRRRWWTDYRAFNIHRLHIKMDYRVASIAISLSGGRNLPGFIPSGAKAPSISSFSVGSARR